MVPAATLHAGVLLRIIEKVEIQQEEWYPGATRGVKSSQGEGMFL